jgi:hypothetical protein
MIETAIFLSALVPVLVLGVALIELLQRATPARGKRPDLPVRRTSSTLLVRVTAPGGRCLRGAPDSVVARLARDGFVGAPRWVDRGEALRLLDAWAAVGRIGLRIEWH